jgi:preprotein translocase subunit SecB
MSEEAFAVHGILNVPKENLHPLVMIECPRLLFPFAREIIATAVRDGGFPPLMLDRLSTNWSGRRNAASRSLPTMRLGGGAGAWSAI